MFRRNLLHTSKCRTTLLRTHYSKFENLHSLDLINLFDLISVLEIISTSPILSHILVNTIKSTKIILLINATFCGVHNFPYYLLIPLDQKYLTVQ